MDLQVSALPELLAAPCEALAWDDVCTASSTSCRVDVCAYYAGRSAQRLRTTHVVQEWQRHWVSFGVTFGHKTAVILRWNVRLFFVSIFIPYGYAALTNSSPRHRPLTCALRCSHGTRLFLFIKGFYSRKNEVGFSSKASKFSCNEFVERYCSS